MRLLVDLDRLLGAEGALLAVARAGGEMASLGDERSDPSVAGGPDSVQEAVEHFVGSWSYGMDLVARDADRLHSLLHAIGAGGTHPATGSSRGAEPATTTETKEAFQVTLTEDADRVEILATWLAECAEQAAAAGSGLAAVDLEAWNGEGAEAFSDAVGMLSARVEKGARAFRDAASTLRACAAVLWEAQLRARQAGLAPASLYTGAGTGGGGTSPEEDRGLDAAGGETLEECRTAAEDGIHRAVVRLRQAADLAPRGPHSPAPDPNAAPSGVGAGLGGVWESVWGLGVFAFEVKPVHDLIEVSSYVETAKGLAEELLSRGPHPVSFPTSTSAWSAWLTHRTRAFGQLLPPRPEPPVPAEELHKTEPLEAHTSTAVEETESPGVSDVKAAVTVDVHEPETAEAPGSAGIQEVEATGVSEMEAGETVDVSGPETAEAPIPTGIQEVEATGVSEVQAAVDVQEPETAEVPVPTGIQEVEAAGVSEVEAALTVDVSGPETAEAPVPAVQEVEAAGVPEMEASETVDVSGPETAEVPVPTGIQEVEAAGVSEVEAALTVDVSGPETAEARVPAAVRKVEPVVESIPGAEDVGTPPAEEPPVIPEVGAPELGAPEQGVVGDAQEGDLAEPGTIEDLPDIEPSGLEAAPIVENADPPESVAGQLEASTTAEPERVEDTIEVKPPAAESPPVYPDLAAPAVAESAPEYPDLAAPAAAEPPEAEPPDAPDLATSAAEEPQVLAAGDESGAPHVAAAAGTETGGTVPGWDWHGVEASQPDAPEPGPDTLMAAWPKGAVRAAFDLNLDMARTPAPDALEQATERPTATDLEPAGEQLRSAPEEPEPETPEPEGQGPAVERPGPVPDGDVHRDGASQPAASEQGPGEEEVPAEARGAASGRPFHPGRAGGPTQRLRASRVRITPRGVAVVEQHVARFGPDEVDAAMVGRLRRIAAGELSSTLTDRNFCVHQLRAFVRYRRLGHATGDPGYEVWNDAHTAALEDYGMHEGPHVLYPVGDTTTDYELAVLRAIGSGQDPVRWYKIEQRLSVMPIQARGSLPDALDALGAQGLVRRGPGSEDTHELTPAGRQYLADQDR